MNRKQILALLVTMAILLLGTSQVTGQQDEPQSPQTLYGSAFTYQGQLKDTGGPVNGTCDLSFTLFDAADGGSQVGTTVTHEGVELADGLFTARLDFGGMDIHNGNARWLEVAVRCPAGSGGYVTLDPRQELTGAPAALSLALPFLAEANIGGPLASFENEGDGEAAVFSSAGGYALWVDTAGLDGLYIGSAGQDGMRVVNAGGRGVAVDTAGGDGVYVGAAMNNGVTVGSAGGTGVFVGSTVNSGVLVDSAGAYGVYVGSASGGVGVNSAAEFGVSVGSAGTDGVYVHQAGSPSAATPSDYHNGFEVAGAEVFGMYVGYAGHSGVYVERGDYAGVNVERGEFAGVVVQSAGWSGVFVDQATMGLYVGWADDTGVFVHSAGWNGVVVEEAGGDGVRATNTVYNALYGDTANAQGEWGLYTPDKVHAQNVALQTLTLIAQVTGPDALSPGDIVAAAGIAAPLPGNGSPLPLVRLAGPDAIGVVGVVEGRLALMPVPQPEGESVGERLELRSAEGLARPGDYVALTVLGVARVKADTGQGSIQPGTWLTSGTGGRARALKTVVVEGLTLAESAPTLGIALTAPDDDSLVWVLVNPQ